MLFANNKISLRHCGSVFVILCLFSLGIQSLYADTGKIALVISNSEYSYGKPTHNIANEAQNMTNVLKQLGFEVTLRMNLNYRAMENAIYEFTNRLRNVPQSTGLFYFAGHGAQGQRQHFLVPVNNFYIRSERHLKFKAVSVNQIVEDMTTASRNSIIILDACYEKPYNSRNAQSLCHGLTTKPLPFSNQSGFLIAYPHEETIRGRNIYTKTLVRILKRAIRKRIGIKRLFMRLDATVYRKSYGRQVSWHQHINLDDFSLGGIRTPKKTQQCRCCTGGFFTTCYSCPCQN
jgi:hypothetical protein